jgi:hypothetical protein
MNLIRLGFLLLSSCFLSALLVPIYFPWDGAVELRRPNIFILGRGLLHYPKLSLEEQGAGMILHLYTSATCLPYNMRKEWPA